MTSCCHYPGLSFEISANHVHPTAQRHAVTVTPIKYDSLHAFSSSMLLFLHPSTFPSPSQIHQASSFYQPICFSRATPPPASGLHGGTFPCRRPSITKISPWSPSANYHISSAVTHVIITASTRLSTDGNYILFSLFHN